MAGKYRKQRVEEETWKTSIKMPLDLAEAIQGYAESEGRSANQEMIRAIRAYLEAKGIQPSGLIKERPVLPESLIEAFVNLPSETKPQTKS